MLTFDEAKRMLAKRESKKLARNTYLREENGRMVIRFWDTDIITITPEDVYTLTSGGYRTFTTKDRLNSFSPANVSQDKGLWYVGVCIDRQWAYALFEDGIKVNRHGHVISGAGNVDFPKVMCKVDRLVSKFIAGYAAHVMEHGLQEDTSGDCWGCLMQAANDPTCKEPMGYSHYLSHFEEKYYVPVMLIKAVKEVGYGNPGIVWAMMKADIERGREPYHIKHALRKYFQTRKLGIAEAIANP